MSRLNNVFASIRNSFGTKSLALAAAAVALGASAPAMAGGHCGRGDGGYVTTSVSVRGGYSCTGYGAYDGYRRGGYTTSYVNVYEPTVIRNEPVYVEPAYQPVVTERVVVEQPCVTERVVVEQPTYSTTCRRMWVEPSFRSRVVFSSGRSCGR